MNLRSIVIFGGGGFIGKTFLKMFTGCFDRITVVDRFSGPAHPRPDAYDWFVRDVDNQRVDTIVADAAHCESLGAVLRAADAVLLLNADTGTANSFVSPGTCVRENVTTLVALAEAIRKFCERERVRVLFTSSRAVYGEGAWSCAMHGESALDRSISALQRKQFEPLCPECGSRLNLLGSPEEGRAVPLSVYGATKRAGEDLLQALLAQDGFDVRIVRYQNVFGPGQEISNPYTGVLNWFSARLIEDGTVEIYERGHIRRDFIYVEDAARLLYELLLAQRPDSRGAWVVNGGSGDAVGLSEVAQMLRHEYGSRSQIVESDKFRIGDVLGARANMERARRDLRFQCSVKLPEGLRRYAAWFKAIASADER